MPRSTESAYESRWCILCCGGRSTLSVARMLRGRGFEAWTPIARLSRRRPRSKLRHEISVPITPTYVFARAAHLPDLIDLADQGGENGFTVMRRPRGVPLVRDEELDDLRAQEVRAAPKRPRQDAERFDIGETVRLTTGSFSGLVGQVERSDPRQTVVALGGSLVLKIDTFALRESAVEAA